MPARTWKSRLAWIAALGAVAAAGVPAAAAGTSAAPSKVRKLTVRITPATAAAGTTVRITVSGTRRTKCSLTVRADRNGSRVSVRRRVKLTSALAIPASSVPGRRVVSVRCGGAKATKRFTVAAVQAAPGEEAFGDLPVDPLEIAGYRVTGNVGGGGFSTRVPLPAGTRVRVSQGPSGSTSHSTLNSRNAIDLEAPEDTPVLAGFTGVVAAVGSNCEGMVKSACNGGWGNFVLLKHVDETCAVHAHLKTVSVGARQQVTRYTQLGTVGASGLAGGPHLHYDHIACGTKISLPWEFEEIGKPLPGEFVVSGNAPADPVATPTPTPTATATPTPTQTATAAPVQTPVVQPPAPSVSIVKGASAQGRSGCSSAACRFINVTLANFGGGGHAVVCRASHGDEGGFWPYTHTGGSGSTSAVCYYGYGGRSVWVTVDGVPSNTIVW